jgi:glycine C-acetyltransferase
MAYGKAKEFYRNELKSIKDGGLFKEERYIHTPQGADITVEYPDGAPVQKVINFCANNYLGLSSHPGVMDAARKGLGDRGYGMSSVRFICGTQDIHRQLEGKLTKFLGTEDTILFGSCMDANAAIFEVLLGK